MLPLILRGIEVKDAGNFRATIGISSQKEVIDIDHKIAINQQSGL